MDKKPDNRANNGGHRLGFFKWGEPKKKRTLTLTDKAWQWLKEKGGSDYIEQITRKKKPHD